MATVRPVLWPHKTNREGHYPIWMRFSDAQRTLYHSLGVYVAKRHWNPNAERVRKTHELHEEINQLIVARLNDAERERLRLSIERKPIAAERLKAVVAGTTTGAACFLTYARAYLDEVEERGGIHRARKERGVLKKLEAFAGNPLPFQSITPDLLERWETRLRTVDKNKASTVQRSMKVVRAHYNRAIWAGLVESNPFAAYTPPKSQPTRRVKLTAEEIKRIERLDLGHRGPKGQGIAKVRAWYLFSFYTAGMRFSDVMRLRIADIVLANNGDDGANWRVSYQMGKTGKQNSVILVEQALAIIEPYLDRPASGYLFDALDRYKTTTAEGMDGALRSRNAYANRLLGEIAKRAKLGKSISFHTARHTFADLARKNGWNLYDVSRALRHSDLRVTDLYLSDADNDALDARMQSLYKEEP
jgi:integrase/recombinase XerD